jgi:aryl-alcohol dehydrogenase-like predicted oxidoreductase
VALAWLLGQGDDVVPIPGTKRIAYLEDNAGEASVTLTDEDRHQLDAAADQVAAPRAHDDTWINRSTPPLTG